MYLFQLADCTDAVCIFYYDYIVEERRLERFKRDIDQRADFVSGTTSGNRTPEYEDIIPPVGQPVLQFGYDSSGSALSDATIDDALPALPEYPFDTSVSGP